MRTQESEWEVLPPAGAPAPRVAASAQTEWEVLPPAAPRAAAPADPARQPTPGLIATTPGKARSGPGSYRGTSDDPVPLDDLSPEQIFNLPPGIFVRYPSGEIDQFSRVDPNASATPTRIERGAQRQYGVLPADEREGPRTLGERFTSTFENVMNEGIPASVGRFAVGAADRSGYRTDPATGERYYVADVGQLTRNAERARRFNFARTTQGDEWYRQQGLVNQMLAGGATLVGGLGGGATDASNYFGGWGKNILTRAAGNFGFGASQDVALQGLDIGSGVQEGYDPGRSLIAGGINAAIPLGVEGAGRIYNRFAPNGTPELYGPPAPDGVGSPRQPANLPDVEVTAAAPGAVERMPMQGDAPVAVVAASAAQPPIVRHRETAAIVEAAAPPVAEGMTRLWRGNRPDETGAGLNFTNDLPGIALPFREAYGGELSYVDIPSSQLADFEIKAGAAPSAEFHLPADLAATARVAALEAPAPAPRTLAEDTGAPGRTPDEVLLGPVVRGLDDEFGIPPQPSPAVARAAEADLTLRAPDEPRAPDARAGNLLLNKFDSTLDVATVLETADTAAGGFAEARRAPQSFAQTEALAEQLGMTADELLKRPNGTAFNAEQSQAARSLLVASAEKVDAIAARIAEKGDPGEDLLNEFRDTVLRHVAIQEQVAGVVAEAGRALGILRNRASSVNITADMLDAMMAGKGPAGLQRAARNIIEARKKGPREQAKAIEKAYRATGFDVFLEYWYNAILSGPYTHIYNVLSTGANVLNSLPVTAGAAAIGAGKKLTGIQWGVERDRVLGSEVYARGVGLLTGAVDGAKAFGTTMRTGGVSDNVDRLDTQVRRAIPGALGTVVRTPSRLLSAEDEFFKATARRMQLNAISLRVAHAEGLRGDAMTARAAELAKNPTEYLSAEADNFARYLTFQTEMGPGGRAILRVLDAWPASRIVVPFVRTPINLMKTTVEHSPFAPLLTEWRDDVKAGGARADVALAKMAVGMGYGVAIATAAGYGLVTGAAPADKTERQALEATGWKPFSIRVGDNYVDYRRMDPFSSILGIAATLGQPQTPHGKPVDLASAFVSGFLGQLTDKTFLTGLSDFVAAASDESGTKIEAWVKRFAGSFVPAIASQTAQIIDPSKRVTETLADTMQSRIPGMSQNLPAQRDILGDPLRTFSPVTPIENDRAAQAIVSTGARVGELGKTLQGRKLTGQEYDAYERLAGQYLREGIENWIDTPDWLEMDDEGRRELIEELATEAREDARQELDLDRPAE